VNGASAHDLYVFGTLDLRSARFDHSAGDYELTPATEQARLIVAGQKLGRVYYAETDVPSLSSGRQHVFLELQNHLGSNVAVIDKATSELVEATNYAAYGQTDSDYRPERWASFREPYKFTGKEEDIEVGLMYFGARFYSPALNRFVSPDPLAVHKPGSADDNLYAYVSGRTFSAVDPDGQALWFIPILVGIAVSAIINVAQQEMRIEQARQQGQVIPFDWGSLALSVGIAAASGGAGAGAGAIAGSPGYSVGTAAIVNTVTSTITSSTLSGAATQVQRMHQGATWNWGQFGTEVGIGVASSALGAGVGAGALKLNFSGASAAGFGSFAAGASSSAMSQYAAGGKISWGVAMMNGAVMGGISYGTTLGLQKAGIFDGPDSDAPCKGPSCGGGAGGCKCFAAGTLVATIAGLKPIEEIRVGDLVLSRDVLTGVTEYKPVTTTFVTEDRELLDLTFRLPNGSSEVITSTPGHPFFVEGKGWVQAAELEIDTEVSTQAGLAKLSSALSKAHRGRAFNFEVADYHTYFVGRGQHLVHNDCPCGPVNGSGAGGGQGGQKGGPGGGGGAGDDDGPPAPANDNGPIGPYRSLVEGDGPVVVKPRAGATPEEMQQYRDHVEGMNQALEAGALSPTGRVRTTGALADAAQSEATKERRAAAARGEDYGSQVPGHTPDTTWTGNPKPYKWQRLDPVVNSSLAGQWSKYCYGYRPTMFILMEWQ